MEMVDTMTGDEFKTARIALGYTNREKIADDIGVSAETIKKWERGERPVRQYGINFIKREQARREKVQRKHGATA